MRHATVQEAKAWRQASARMILYIRPRNSHRLFHPHGNASRMASTSTAPLVKYIYSLYNNQPALGISCARWAQVQERAKPMPGQKLHPTLHGSLALIESFRLCLTLLFCVHISAPGHANNATAPCRFEKLSLLSPFPPLPLAASSQPVTMGAACMWPLPTPTFCTRGENGDSSSTTHAHASCAHKKRGPI